MELDKNSREICSISEMKWNSAEFDEFGGKSKKYVKRMRNWNLMELGEKFHDVTKWNLREFGGKTIYRTRKRISRVPFDLKSLRIPRISETKFKT